MSNHEHLSQTTGYNWNSIIFGLQLNLISNLLSSSLSNSNSNWFHRSEAVEKIPPEQRTPVTGSENFSEIRDVHRIRHFLDVQTSGKVNLKQNLTGRLILTSIWPQVAKNRAFLAKNEIFDPEISPTKFFLPTKFFFADKIFFTDKKLLLKN